ncbi:MAG: hypothetical protein HON76_21125 [Candidatus Scalindua sp.]|jgi:hypothetical protein|nr:hypothetical protein [Candidatus Scalindua sp.]MBT6565022.1 hypothetical protein [Candidatus Scalindua sp.]
MHLEVAVGKAWQFFLNNIYLDLIILIGKIPKLDSSHPVGRAVVVSFHRMT